MTGMTVVAFKAVGMRRLLMLFYGGQVGGRMAESAECGRVLF
jgi:hypothetical protein